MAFHFKDVPERDNIEFRTLVERPRRVSKFPDTYKNSQTTPSPASSSLRPVDPLQEASNQRRAPYISFGEQGTTATAGAYGSLLRTCRPISKLKGSNGFPNSGIIGLEFASTEPWYVSGRANLILENAHDASCGFGLLVQNDLSSDRPTVEFVDGRWPVIKYSTKEGFAVTVRLWCQHDTVVQHMHVMNPKLVTGEKPELRINLDPNFSMQDLDYLREKKNESTRYEKGVNDHGIIVMQVPGLRDKNDDDNEKLCDARELVSVLIGLFKDGAAQELQLNYTEDERETKSRVQPIPITHPLGRDESVEFTTAFKTHTTTLEAHWRRFMIPSEEVIFDPHLSSLVNSTMMKLKDMSWYLYRNLEHIMSVCSIPIDLDSLDETGSISSDRLKNYGPTIALTSPGGERDILSRTEPTVRSIRPIALTCGDFGDHRVSMLGSYYSFMFMLEMHAQWSVKKDVRQRIYEICTGHLQWVSRLDTRAASSSNIWIDGRDADLSDEGGLIDLPHDSPISMPSHIIKATEYLKVFPDTSDLAFVCRWLYGFALKWFDQLIETKNHITPTWQHSRGSDIPKYRLSDQIWIWKALKSLEDLVIRVEQVQKTTSNEMLEKFLQIKENLYSRGPGASKPSTKLEFNSDGLRNENIRRFTLYNDVARSHMLSVTRSARETRFLLHDKDTVLYYGLEWGFFDKSEKYWTRLVHNQTEHDKDCNDEAQWNSPLRYGLAIEMAKHNHQFDSDFPASEMAVHSKQIVVNSSSETGLFPGNLNNEKEPAIFEHEAYRDFYFHSGFEIPYILVRCEKKGMNLRIMSVENAIGDSEERPPAPSPVPIRPLARSPTMAREPRSSSRPRDISPFQGAIIDGQLRDDPDFPTKFLAFGTSRTLKRQNPYGRLIDLSNIVEIPEEWLYKYPEFLDYVPPTNEKEILRIKTESSPSIRDEKLFGLLIARRPVVGECYVRVDDIRKGQKHQKWSNEKKITTVIHKEYRGLWNQLQKGRSAEKTKKRLIYLRSIDYTVAAICYVSSTERERSDIAQFFDRHAKVDTSYLYDDTAVVFNSWITEVHFRFHKLKDTKMAPQPDSRVRRLRSQGCKYLQHDAHIVDEVIGFRIVGDFFDRYWTCHVVHTCSKTESSILDESHQKEKHWQQRKVLELILFNSILANVWNSIDVILGKLELQSGIFSSDSFEDRRPDELLKCFQLLVILKNNIIGLQALIEQWDRRESVRGRGRPRWTRSDEEKYRKSIDKQLADFEGHIRDIKAMTARIEFLITLVTNAQETIRSKKSLTEAENITLFTYVTAFFLPTGLAASVFSMNGVPSSTVIASMVITAAVALLITAGILWCLLSQYVRSRARDFLGLFQSGDKLINSRE